MSLGLGLWWQTAKKAANGAVRHGGGAGSGAKAGSNSHLLRWLMSLGGLGLFGVGIIDSSVIPLPLPGSSDLLLLLLASHRGSTVKSAIWLAFCTFAGSMIGGYLTWGVGHKGGEAALERYIPKRLLGKVKGWVEGHGPWAVGLATILPPPVPLTPFILAAGALGVTRGKFLTFYGVARALRYGALAWIAATYGRHVVRVWQKQIDEWSGPILWAYGVLVGVGLLYALVKFLKARRSRGQIAPTGDQAGNQPGNEAAEEPA